MISYFTCIKMDNKEYPCNQFTKKWGFLIRLKNKIIEFWYND